MPAALAALIEAFLAHLAQARQLSHNTVVSYGSDLRLMQQHLATVAVTQLAAVRAEHLSAWARQLAASGRKPASQARAICAARQLFRYAQVQGLVGVSPAKKLVAPRWQRQAPQVGTYAQVRALIDRAAQGAHPARRLRDIALLELLYGGGLRASEVCGLQLGDLQLSEGLVHAHAQPGAVGRLVPIGQRAGGALADYLAAGRGHFAGAGACPWVFAGRGGRPLTRMGLYTIVRRHGQPAGHSPPLGPHALRHAFAAHLLHNGADLQAVQKMLGHQSASSTEFYGHAGPGSLQQAVQQHHPLGRHAPLQRMPTAPRLRVGERRPTGAAVEPQGGSKA